MNLDVIIKLIDHIELLSDRLFDMSLKLSNNHKSVKDAINHVETLRKHLYNELVKSAHIDDSNTLN